MMSCLGSKFGRELNSIFSLVVLNVVFSNIGMALSIAFTVENMVAALDLTLKEVIVTWRPITIWLHPQFLLGILSIAAAGLSLKWVIHLLEILWEIDNIEREYKENSKKLVSSILMSLIVKTMAYYRDKKTAIKRLSIFSGIGGLCFLASAALQMFNGLFTIDSVWSLIMVAHRLH